MSAVGAPTRTGWLQEPTCQNCHTGTATDNNGADPLHVGVRRRPASRASPADATFATTANTPAAGLSLYRFSAGHGGLQCSACHGSTHAEYPSSHPNDNLQSVALQGHVGHDRRVHARATRPTPSTTNGGPHGMHPVGAGVGVEPSTTRPNRTGRSARRATAPTTAAPCCRASFAARTLTTELRHQARCSAARRSAATCATTGRRASSANPNRPPVATQPVGVHDVAARRSPSALSATDPDGNALTLRIVSQPSNGTVGPVRDDRDLLPVRRVLGHRHVHLRRMGRVDRLQPGNGDGAVVAVRRRAR